jgi:hypothetical protein
VLKLKYDKLLSIFAFNFNLRRYTEDVLGLMHRAAAKRQGLTLVHVRARVEQLQDTFMS